MATFKVAAAAVPPADDRLVHSLPIASIQPSRRNPRQRMDRIDELKESLRTHGLLEPIVVRRHRDGYELIAGHRRLEAAKLLEWTTIEAKVLVVTPEQAYILTLVENLQREDLTAAEEAEALVPYFGSAAGPFAKSLTRFGVTQCTSVGGCACSRIQFCGNPCSSNGYR